MQRGRGLPPILQGIKINCTSLLNFQCSLSAWPLLEGSGIICRRDILVADRHAESWIFIAVRLRGVNFSSALSGAGGGVMFLVFPSEIVARDRNLSSSETLYLAVAIKAWQHTRRNNLSLSKSFKVVWFFRITFLAFFFPFPNCIEVTYAFYIQSTANLI